MSEPVVTFKDPPKAKGGISRGRHAAIAAELRARPGEWALILQGVSGASAHQIKSATISAYRPAGSFEATTRRRPDGRFDIYARYVGAPE